MKLRALIATLALVFPISADAYETTPSAEIVRDIEAQVIMPQGSGPLASYRRSYQFATVDVKGESHYVVVGKFVALDWRGKPEGTPVKGMPNVFVLSPKERLPDIADGGCIQVTVWFDVGTHSIISKEKDRTVLSPLRPGTTRPPRPEP